MRKLETGLFLNKIPYARIGSGPDPIVVLNGGQDFVRRSSPERTARDAKRIARLLPRDRAIYVLGYDQAPPAGYAIDTIVGDVERILREEIGPAALMGISFGGFAAARLAARTDLVTELILMVNAHRVSPEGRRSIDRQIESAWAGDFDSFVNEFVVAFRRPWFNWLIGARLKRERRRLHETMNDPVTIVRSLNAVANEDFGSDPSWLSRITAPTLIVGGTKDIFFDAAALEETARMIPSAQLKLFRHETHMLPVERARDVARAVKAFLRGPRAQRNR